MDALRRILLPVIGLICARAAAAGIAPEDFGGSVVLTSDGMFHGISQTCGDPAAQGDLHYRSSGGQSAPEGFAGIWGSAGLGQSACGKARELNFYAGYSLLTSSNSSASLTYTHYGYPGGDYTIGQLAGHRYDYDALEAQWAWQDRVSLTLAWTPDALGYKNFSVLRDRSALSYGLQLHQPLAAGFSLAAGVGYDQIADPFGTGYGFWNAGVGYTLGDWQLDAGYFGTASRAVRLFGSYVAGSQASVSVVWRF
ncbi:MAG TPA: TorF family putative porin [Steroidobacteraceae bacterium]